ncbi:MAG: hypothetical protein QOH48_2214 [Actinomycetota bacterium]|jgi:hypothetical protein|nr:hypothetical protein [Actinomycetota bacterium]
MSAPLPQDEDARPPLDQALADVDELSDQAEEHEARLDALERLHGELEAELDDADADVRPGP